jgi:hypothetical protein
MRMKNRWIPVAALATLLALAACAPQQGADASAEASVAATPAASSHDAQHASASPVVSPGASADESDSAEPTPEDYEY